eukprot:gene8940-31513_t
MPPPPPPPGPPPPPAPALAAAKKPGPIKDQAAEMAKAMAKKGLAKEIVPVRPKTPPPAPEDVLQDVTLEWVGASTLFNALQVGSQMTVIDVRTKEEFEASHLRSAINVPLADIAGKSLMDVEKEYNMRFRQRRTNKVLVYDQDSTEASTSSATADFGALLKEDRRAARPVALVTGGLQGMVEKYPFLVMLKEVELGGASGADAPPTTHVFSDDEYPSEILDDFLFLGAYGAAKTRHVLDDLGIVRVVNASETCAMPFEDLKYIKCALDDKPGADIRQYFPDLLDFLETAEKGKEKVLIHCQMGMSRSSTLVILWLMHKHGMPFINPNPGFMQQLGEWEAEKFGVSTIRFPQDGQPITLRTIYEWLQEDGTTWVKRVVVGYT